MHTFGEEGWPRVRAYNNALGGMSTFPGSGKKGGPRVFLDKRYGNAQLRSEVWPREQTSSNAPGRMSTLPGSEKDPPVFVKKLQGNYSPFIKRTGHEYEHQKML